MAKFDEVSKGMSKEQVRQLLGRPDAKGTVGSFMNAFEGRVVALRGPSEDTEVWRYQTPFEDAVIYFSSGEVSEVKTRMRSW